jgi:Flp pilus assembly protein TadB
LPRNKIIPPCPACGSSSTLPFENEENARTEQTFAEIILTIFLLFLVLFVTVLLFLLSHASLPIGMLLLLVIFLFWRRKRDNQRTEGLPHEFVCLDCSRNFKA